MRRLLTVPALLVLACTSSPAPNPEATGGPTVYGLTVAEEATLLRLEDRREFDPALSGAWADHPNALHRKRIAMALGRIGPMTFVDANGNGQRDSGEQQAGVEILIRLASDPDRGVRETTAFALGEAGDASGIDALLALSRDADAAVAAEAAEALSKMSTAVTLARYSGLTGPDQRPPVRRRAVRFLFRFDSDDASSIAAALLDSPDLELRETAAYVLARRAYAPARGALELLLTDPTFQTRAYAASALGRISAGESTGKLIAALDDLHPWVRTNALVALTRIATKDPDAIIRADLATDARRVIDMTEDPDPGTRASSIDTLGHFARKSETAKKRLADLMTSGSRWGRELAVGAWVKQFGPAPIQTSWERVRSLEGRLDVSVAQDPDPMVRAAVLANIADDKVNDHLELIRAAIEDPDIIVRANAVDRYGKTRGAEVALLREFELRFRKDTLNDARLAAIGAIAEIDDPGRETFLRSLIRDADPVVRRVAADAIEQKLKMPRPQTTPLAVDRALADYETIVTWSRSRHTATIRTARGSIELLLLTPDAPITAWNFATLARRGYFDNTSFMRVVPNFVIQGGDPRNDMNGGPGYAIRDEINLQKYVRGAVGMALSGPDTGGSQFFITHSPQPHLDGGYTIFGRVTGGLAAVVDQMERGDKVETILIDGTPPR